MVGVGSELSRVVGIGSGSGLAVGVGSKSGRTVVVGVSRGLESRGMVMPPHVWYTRAEPPGGGSR